MSKFDPEGFASHMAVLLDALGMVMTTWGGGDLKYRRPGERIYYFISNPPTSLLNAVKQYTSAKVTVQTAWSNVRARFV